MNLKWRGRIMGAIFVQVPFLLMLEVQEYTQQHQTTVATQGSIGQQLRSGQEEPPLGLKSRHMESPGSAAAGQHALPLGSGQQSLQAEEQNGQDRIAHQQQQEQEHQLTPLEDLLSSSRVLCVEIQVCSELGAGQMRSDFVGQQQVAPVVSLRIDVLPPTAGAGAADLAAGLQRPTRRRMPSSEAIDMIATTLGLIGALPPPAEVGPPVNMEGASEAPDSGQAAGAAARGVGNSAAADAPGLGEQGQSHTKKAVAAAAAGAKQVGPIHAAIRSADVAAAKLPAVPTASAGVGAGGSTGSGAVGIPSRKTLHRRSASSTSSSSSKGSSAASSRRSSITTSSNAPGAGVSASSPTSRRSSLSDTSALQQQQQDRGERRTSRSSSSGLMGFLGNLLRPSFSRPSSEPPTRQHSMGSLGSQGRSPRQSGGGLGTYVGGRLSRQSTFRGLAGVEEEKEEAARLEVERQERQRRAEAVYGER